MTIPEEMIELAIACTTWRGSTTPNAYRVTAWLREQRVIADNPLSLGTYDEFSEVVDYLHTHYNVTTMTLRATSNADTPTPTPMLVDPPRPSTARLGGYKHKRTHAQQPHIW